MRPYEIMIILDPDIEERAVGPTVDKFLTVITAAGGTVDNIDLWGKRRLAYEILKKQEGYYAVVQFTATPSAAKELDRQLGLNESVLRTKLLRIEAH
jgi:small subunit ribosomal protein S6